MNKSEILDQNYNVRQNTLHSKNKNNTVSHKQSFDAAHNEKHFEAELMQVTNTALDEHPASELKFSKNIPSAEIYIKNKKLISSLAGFDANAQKALYKINLLQSMINENIELLAALEIVEANLVCCEKLSYFYINKAKAAGQPSLKKNLLVIDKKDKKLFFKSIFNVFENTDILKKKYFKMKQNQSNVCKKKWAEIALWTSISLLPLGQIASTFIPAHYFKYDDIPIDNSELAVANINLNYGSLSLLTLCGLNLHRLYHNHFSSQNKLCNQQIEKLITSDIEVLTNTNLYNSYHSVNQAIKNLYSYMK